MAVKSFAEIKSNLDAKYSGNNSGANTQTRATSQPYFPTIQTIQNTLKKKKQEEENDSDSDMIAPVRSDIGTAGSNLGAPLRSSAGTIAQNILAPLRSDIAPVRSDIAPVSLMQQQKQQQGAVQAWASQTGAKVNPWMMANANANYAQDQLTKTEEAYDAFLQANQNSSTPPVNLPEAVKLQEKAAGLDSEVAYWENQKTNHKNQAVMQKDMEEFEQWPEEDKKLMEQYARGKNLMPLDIAATSAQQKLREKYGLETLNRMEESYSWYRNQENTKKVADLGREHATGAAGKTLSSIASVGTNLMSNAAGAMDTLYAFTNDAITGTGRYSGLDPNLRGNLGAVYSGAVRGKVSEDLEKHGTLGKVGSVAYQGTMSGLDSFARLYSAGEAGALVLAGMGSFSQTVSEASAKGASPEQAIGLGVINAGLEVATEKVSLGNLLDQSATGYQGALKAVKDAFVQAGVEVSEEELSFIGSTLAEAAILREKSSYNQQIGELVANGMSYENAKKQADRALIDEAVKTAAVSGFSGGLMSGAASVVNKVSASQNNQTTLTENEQKVVDKVTSDRIAEQEKDGKKLTDKAKKQIRESVIREMEDGSISTDTIEEVLGGETYKTYKDTIDSEDAIKKEFDTLNKMKQGEMTGEQIDRRTELKDQLETIKNEGKRDQLKSQLGEEVMALTKGDRLSESYNEKGRRGQAFEADLSKYDAKQQKVIQKAVESGILNNTNRTHKFVDWIARVSADKDILFDFTNNAKLKESGFALEGKTVNGYVTKDGVTININSAKALNSVVGHEITHVVKGTKFYAELQKTLFDYAKNKGEYQGRLDSLTKLYEGVEGTDIDEELTADLVGDYLFTDADFVNRLSTENRNVFQKLYDEIKYICRVAAAGSKEAKQLEKAKKIFEDAFRAEAKNTVTEDGVRYSLANIDDVTPNEEQKAKNIQEVAEMNSVYAVDASKLVPGEKSIKETYREFFTEWGENIHSDVFGDIAVKNSSIRSEMRHGSTPVKVASIEAIPSVIQNGKIVEWIQKDSGLFRIVVAAPIEIGESPYFMGVMLQRDSQNQRLYLHDVVIEKEASDLSQEHLDSTGPYEENENLYTSNILDKIIEVKQNAQLRKNSLSADGEQIAPYGNWNVSGKDIALDIAPVGENVAVQEKTQLTADNSTDLFPDDFPIREELQSAQETPDNVQTDGAESAAKSVSTRKELHQSIIDRVKSKFSENGFDFDEVLKNAKNLSTFATVDNTPQRVMEKALGYKEGGILADETVNKVAQNESAGIKWLNSFTDRKNGLLAQISKQYNIKPGSKQSAAAQMYAEGFYVDEKNDIIRYGDAELAADFPDAKVRANIKGLAKDPRIRQIYDETLASINESRTRNAYPEIPRLDNYFLHFRAMEDTFSRLGLPFNPNDIRAKDLPTDLNGVTADLKPGQPYFSSSMHRTGKRTSFDLLGGLERYLTSAKNQIYHIDDIQTLRALRNYVADTYGQAKGLEDLDSLSEEEAQERIQQVYNSHMSTFAKFLNEEANVLAGKTALIDRGLEGIIGRRGITFLNTMNQQVGSNMVGYNVSSSLTNFLPVAQTFAKTNKFDFTKAFAQTVSNKIGSIFGRSDDFAENSPVIIRRKGADRFNRTPWQKISDPGYALMGAVDDISTELIARTKYNEFTRKGMDSQQAHFETDKWVSKLMGDRSLGQMPQLYNSKMLGLVTKFQLEVRNQLDSQFYDTIQETKASNENIQNALSRNAKTAAKVTSTFVQLAVAQHLFGKAFESLAGYNPAFDIIDVLIKACGFDDDEESEDTVLDNIEQGFFALLDDLPYISAFTGGGRIPISSALPITEFINGEDQYGNEKPRLETLGEAAPYYLMPGGYGQAKKTAQGLWMYLGEALGKHPIAGSYTDSGNLRFPVEDTLANRVKAGVFGQYASENARDYFDNGESPLNEKQTQEFKALDIPIQDYWAYRDEAKKISDRAESEDASDEDILKSKYLNSVNSELSELIKEKEEVLESPFFSDKLKQEQIDRIQEQFDELSRECYESYKDVSIDGDYASVGDRVYKRGEDGEWSKLSDEQLTKYEVTKAAWDAPYATDGTNHYRYYVKEGETKGTWEKLSEDELKKQKEVTSSLGISPQEYWGNKSEYDYAYQYPENYAVAKAVGGYDAYTKYSQDLYNIKADKDKNGKSISGSKQAKVLDYINNLDADYYTKLILYKSQYNSYDDQNDEILEYLNGRTDLTYQEKVSILKKLGANVDSEGKIKW